MTIFMFYIYRFFLVPFAIGMLNLFRPFLGPKLREVIRDKNQGYFEIKGSLTAEQIAKAHPFWIHAASGEIEYARPVIRELRRQYPNIFILVTYSSPSAKGILKNIPEVDVWAALPWEVDSKIYQFIKIWNPRILLFARTDVWPVLTTVAKREGIPMALFSATFADNSSRLRGVGQHLTRFALSHLSEIHCVSAEDIINLNRLGLNIPVYASGDTRFDQVFHRLANPKVLKNNLMPSPDEFVFIAGSTWPEDEKVLLTALAKARTHKMKVIIAPHETTEQHLSHLEKEFQALELPSIRYSQSETWSAETILIIDQVGILAELYTWADIAFVGGSFKKQVHSVMEALAAGLPVMVGPHHQNNREALFYQKKNYSSGMIVQVVHSSEDIVVLLERIYKLQDSLAQIKEEIRSEIEKNRNSTLRVLTAIEKVLEIV